MRTLKSIFPFLASMLPVMYFMTNCSRQPADPPYALYDWFEYQGKDPVFDALPTDTAQFRNPLLPGFYPDPSICRVDSDYYMVNSTFSYYPGIPIFHSRDLVHWKQLGHVLDRPSQLDLDSLQLSWGVFAPAIQYHNGTFYVINTIVYGGGNFYVTATNPAGPWSDPVWLKEIDGIDPSFFFDDNGKAYIVNNGPPPDGKELYTGHRALWMQEFLPDSGKLTGPRKIIVNAGVDISKKPVWIEGPHLIKKDGYYYLIAAEGGTATDHSEVVFRSQSVWGPYKAGPENPILTQRHLSGQRLNPVTSTGHADFVETLKGEWWTVFLGCRPYEDDFYNTGRETFMLPVIWKNGWPKVTDVEVPYVVQKPDIDEDTVNSETLNGNFTWRDDFNEPVLNLKWNMIRTPRSQWYSLSSDPGFVRLDLQPVSIREISNPSFIGRRQQHAFFTAVTNVKPGSFDTLSTAGLIAFQNENHYIYLGIKKEKKGYSVYCERSGKDANDSKPEILATGELKGKNPAAVFLKIEGRGARYDFYYSLDPANWTLLTGDVDARNLSTNIAGGFVGSYLGLYGSTRHRFPENTMNEIKK